MRRDAEEKEREAQNSKKAKSERNQWIAVLSLIAFVVLVSYMIVELDNRSAQNDAIAQAESSTPAPSITPTENPVAAVVPTPKQFKSSHVFTVKTSTKMDYNNHVGNDWSYSYIVNGTEVKSGDIFALQTGESITVGAACEESDSIPDDGSNTYSGKVTQQDIENGFQITIPITVYENKGRYTGNDAGFTATIDFER